MFDPQLIAFTAVAAALTITPGADTLLVLRNVIKGNRRDGIVTTFGICSGLFVHALLSGMGLSVILIHSARLYHWVKIAGAIYLIWLGVQSLKSAFTRPDGLVEPGSQGQKGRSFAACFSEGFLNNVLNPKVVVFYLAFLPQFIGPDDPVMAKSVLLAGIHYLMGIVWLVFLSVFVDRMRRFVARSAVRQSLEGICGGILVALGARLAMEK